MIELHIWRIEILRFVEQNMSVIVMVQNDVSRSRERMYERLIHELDQQMILRHIEIIINGEIIIDFQLLEML